MKSVAGFRPYTLGAQLGTTSYQFITNRSTSRARPQKVYNSNALAVAALKNKRIDGLVVDLPTAFYVTAVQVPNSKILGQFKSTTGEHFHLPEGQLARRLREQGAQGDEVQGDAGQDREDLAVEGRRRPDPEVAP